MTGNTKLLTKMKSLSRLRACCVKPVFLILSGLLLGGFSGCSSVGPSSVARDRFDYTASISDSWKREMLLNLLKIRYADTPVFLDVTSVISSYTLSRDLGLNAQFSLPGRGDQYSGVAVNGHYEDRPTITYSPLSGDKFARSLLTPIPIQGVMYLIQGGYPVDLVMRMLVNSINGLENEYGGSGNPRHGNPEFFELIENLRMIQAAGMIGTRIKKAADKESMVFYLRPVDADGTLYKAQQRTRELLGLKADALELTIVYGSYPSSNTEIAMITRSVLQILTDIAASIEVPGSDIEEGRVFAMQRSSYQRDPVTPLVKVKQGEAAPADAYVATRYRNRWFWIEDTDIRSKSLFSFLMFIFALTETSGSSAQAPLVTVPTR